MWLPSPADLLNTSEPCLLLLQGWWELNSARSPDSFQARVLDIPLLLEELIAISRLAYDDALWNPHIREIGLELRASAEEEALILATKPQLQFAIEDIARLTSAGQFSSAEILEKSQIARSLFGDPIQIWIDDLRQRAKGLPKNKRAFLQRLSSVATQARRLEIDVDTLCSPIQSSQCLNGANLDSAITSIQDILTSPSSSYRCIFALSGSRGDIAAVIQGSAFGIARTRHEIRGDSASLAFEQKNQGRTFVYIDAAGRSHLSAALSATSRLETLLNVFNLYANASEPAANTEVLVYRDQEPTPMTMQLDARQQFGLLPRKNARKLTRQTLSQVGSRLDGRIANALEQYSSGLASADPKMVMMNFWTGLEALVGNDGPEKIGSRIRHWIAPIVAWRRIDKIATYLGICGHNYLEHTGTKIASPDLPLSQDTYIHVQDMVRALTGPRDNAAIIALFKALSGSPLLINRISETWTEFSNPRLLRNSFVRSKQRVEWQLSRIYRARNLLVHRGETSDLMPRLLQNMQYYLSICLSRVLHDLRDRPTWSTSTSLTYQRQRFDYVVNSLEQGGKSLTIQDVIPRKLGAPDERLWP